MFRILAIAAAMLGAPAIVSAQDGHGTHPEHGHSHAAFVSDRIHIRVDGDMDGRDIILIPGLSSSPEVWQGTVDHLTAQDGAGWRIHRIHVQGFAGAPAEGNAQGATPSPVADQIWTAQSSSPREAYVAQATTSINGMINTESRRAEALEDMRTSDQKVSAAAFRELITTDLRPELSKITAPTEVLYVKFNDPRMTPQITDSIYRMSFANLKDAQLKRIDDSAHFIMLDQPDVFYSALDAFVGP